MGAEPSCFTSKENKFDEKIENKTFVNSAFVHTAHFFGLAPFQRLTTTISSRKKYSTSKRLNKNLVP